MKMSNVLKITLMVILFSLITVSMAASDPSPANGTVGVLANTVLSWTEDTSVYYYKVYFGTDSTPDSEEYKGNQNETTYDPGTMAYNTTYYWRIDELTDSGIITGTVWSFTTSAPAPVARWRMDDNTSNTAVFDCSGNDYHGAFIDDYGNPNTSYHHRADRWEGSGALTFDGSNDHVQVSGYQGVLGQASRTCMAWVKTSATQTGSIVYWGTMTTGQAWLFRVEYNGALSVTVLGGFIKTTAAVNDGQWHHVAAVLNDDGSPSINEIRLYIDGQLQNTTVNATQAINTVASQDVMIGAYKSSPTDYPSLCFEGSLDDVRIYDYALSSEGIQEIQAWNPPLDDWDVSVDSDLRWQAAAGVLSYDVYLGTSQSTVASAQRLLGDINGDGPVDIMDLSILGSQWLTNPGTINYSADIVVSGKVDIEDFAALESDWGRTPDTEFKANQTDTFYDPGTLGGSTTYYWRIDEVSSSGTTTGTVQSFTTRASQPTAVVNPSPTNGSTNVFADVNLSWTAGLGATSHDVYFGTDSTPDSTEYKGNQPNATYDPGTLANDTTYYWRIDEVNAYGTTTGTVWSFTTTSLRLTPEEFPIIPWTEPWRTWGPADSIETFSEIYDCGFNVADFVTPSGLDIAAATGLKGIVFDNNLHVLNDTSWDSTTCNQKALTAVNSYGNHPALFAYYLRDEPGADLYPTLGRLVDAFHTYDPYHLSYINLFPNYANSSQMDVSTYQQYVDSYVSTVQPDYISYDNYLYPSSSYWSNLATIRTAAKNKGIPFWNIVQSVKVSSSTTTPSPATLRFQLYTSLAYGARGIGWYLYFCWPSDLGDHSLAPIDPDGNKTNTWYYLRDVNLAMHQIGQTYITLNNLNYYHNGTPSGWSVSGSDYLVGHFSQQGTGQSYILLVNKSLTSSVNYTVSESLSGSLYYVSPSDGQHYPLTGTLTLAAGEGRLLTVQ